MIVSESVIKAGSALFSVDPDSLHPLGGTDGAVYSCRRGNLAYVIKFVPVKTEKVARYPEILAFIHYLAENGVPIATPVPSDRNNYFEVLPGEETAYLILLTPRAAGRNPTSRNLYDWTDRLFHAWGQVTGKMHALARRYPFWERPSGESGETQETLILDWAGEHRFFMEWCTEPKIKERWELLYEMLNSLPRNRTNYGLIHNDLHMWNFFYDPDVKEGSTITIIDFDVCAYHWFVTDIAIALYHAVTDGPPKNLSQREAFARRFLEPYLRGYRLENEPDLSWLQNLPIFLTHREILSYIALSNSWPKESRNKWQNDFLAVKRKRILTGEPVIASL